ncbi:MAG: hypothetical protein U9R14_01750 [Patescibacteria group bacterium]|nr:hypothetical protein [Patescibacteria group bacterium]
MYNYATLDPRPIPAANTANEKVFATGPVVGIEVTVPALASRCVTNIDPQHAGQNVDLAAIEEALTAELPPSKSVLATVRADLDSVGAMTVFNLRQDNSIGRTESVWQQHCPRCSWDHYGLCDDILGRVKLVAESDKFARGGWPGVRPLPTAEKPFDNETASAESDSRLAPIAAAVADFKVLLPDRVAIMERWLLTGEEPAGYREKFVAARQELAKAIANGAIDAKSVAEGKIARVISTHRAATSIGYCMSPVVVALNPEFRFQGGEPHKKFTICQFTPGYVDLKAVLAELAGLEQGWGGSPIIGGSPQGVSSTLTIEQVVEVVAKHLK